MTLRDRLRKIDWLHKLHIVVWQCDFRTKDFFRSLIGARCAYWFVLRRICRRLTQGDQAKVKVVFLVTEVSKWKGQSVYDLMAKSIRYSPTIAVFPTQREREAGVEEESVQQKFKYFSDRGMSVVSIWRQDCHDTVRLEDIRADVVFYQQPWELTENTIPYVVGKTALTFYFPYYLVNGIDLELELGQELHKYLYGYIVLNEKLAKIYREAIGKFHRFFTTRFLALGHPILDGLHKEMGSENVVIYAPHWSFAYGNHQPRVHYSTFLENGKLILEFAKRYREIRWAFKPHPLLRYDLEQSGAMTKQAVDAYYAEWEKLGSACYDAEYLELFSRSRAMITDCGSFLSEYGATGNPIVRPINPNLNVEPNPILKDLYSTYYATRGNKELMDALEMVIARGEDPNREKRLAALNDSGLLGVNAAENIVNYLNNLFHIR